MSSKRGNRQFKSLKHSLFNSDQVFDGYPHRQHRKNKCKAAKRSDGRVNMKKIREINHFKSLEEEIKDL